MLKRAVRHFRDGLLSLGYPEECKVCGNAIESWDDGVACERCWTDRTVTSFFADLSCCDRCGTPLQPIAGRKIPSQSRADPTSGTNGCNVCRDHPYFAARACGEYDGAIEASIIFQKVHPYINPRMRDMINRTLALHSLKLASDFVVPVPLHRFRERERGFNQALVVARLVARTLELEVRRQVLARVKYTERHRAGMDARDRARSVEKAFKVIRPEEVRNRSVLIVDDLLTTGSTVCAAAGELLDAGAARVSVFTIARVSAPSPLLANKAAT